MPATAPAPADIAAAASRLRVSVTRLARTLRREAGEGISPTMLSALTTIEHHGPMTAGAFAEHERVRKPTTTRTIRELVDRGMVSRTPDPFDGRVVWLDLTSEGRRFLRRLRRRTDEFLSRRLRRLTPSEVDLLERASLLIERLSGAEA
jgi:DNA-binding MarR family transcriptional regulator